LTINTEHSEESGIFLPDDVRISSFHLLPESQYFEIQESSSTPQNYFLFYSSITNNITKRFLVP
jgi:hypothetical protein